MKNYFWLIKWRDTQTAFYKTFPKIQKAHYIKKAAKLYAYTEDELRLLWEETERAFVPGKQDFLGLDRTVGGDFFYTLAKWDNDEAVLYTCVEGNCTIYFNERRNCMAFAFGRAGCPCNDVRDLTTRREQHSDGY